MDLHTSKVSDWELVPAGVELNPWQKVAAHTHGIVTPANAITLLGNVLTFGGLVAISKERPRLGLSAIVLGRLADVVDGKVAHATGTKSPLGEALDAGFDKVQAVVAIPVMLRADIVPRLEASIIGSQQLLMAGATVVAKLRGKEIHPRLEGKLATAAAWGSLVSYGYAEATESVVSTIFEAIGFASLVAATSFGAHAIAGYAQDAQSIAPYK